MTNFIAVCGDKPFAEITREDAVTYHDWWSDRISGKISGVGHSAAKRMSGNSGNRDLAIVSCEQFPKNSYAVRNRKA